MEAALEEGEYGTLYQIVYIINGVFLIATRRARALEDVQLKLDSVMEELEATRQASAKLGIVTGRITYCESREIEKALGEATSQVHKLEQELQDVKDGSSTKEVVSIEKYPIRRMFTAGSIRVEDS